MNLKTIFLLFFSLLVLAELPAQANEFITIGRSNDFGIEKSLGGVLTENGTIGSIFLKQRAGTNLLDLGIHELNPVDGNLLNTVNHNFGFNRIQHEKLLADSAGGFVLALQDRDSREVIILSFSSIHQLKWVKKYPYSQEQWKLPVKVAADPSGGIFLVTRTLTETFTQDSLFRLNTAGEQLYGLQLHSHSEQSTYVEGYGLAPAPDGSLAITLPGQQTNLFCKLTPSGGMIWETALEEGVALPLGVDAKTPVGLVRMDNGSYGIVARSQDNRFYWLTYDSLGVNQSATHIGENLSGISYSGNHPLVKISAERLALGHSIILSLAEGTVEVISLPRVSSSHTLFTNSLTRYTFSSYYIHSSDGDIQVAAIRADGTTNWEKRYGESAFEHREHCKDAFLDPASGDYFILSKYDFNRRGSQVVIFRQNALGEVIDIKPVNNDSAPGDWQNPNNMIRLDNGKIVCTYQSDDGLHLVVLDKDLIELQRAVLFGVDRSNFLAQINDNYLVLRTLTWNSGAEPETNIVFFKVGQNRFCRNSDIPGFAYDWSLAGGILPGGKLLLCGWDDTYGDQTQDIKLITTNLERGHRSTEQVIPGLPGEGNYLDLVILADGNALLLVRPFSFDREVVPSPPYLLQINEDGEAGNSVGLFPADYDQTVASAEIHRGNNDSLVLYYTLQQALGDSSTFQLFRMKLLAGNLEVVADDLVSEGPGVLNLRTGQLAEGNRDFVAGTVNYQDLNDTDIFLSFPRQLAPRPSTPRFFQADVPANQPAITPNPASDRVQLTFTRPQPTEVTVRLFNRSGRSAGPLTFMQADADALAIPLGKVPPGIYTVLGTRPDGSIAFTSRLVKL